MCQLCSCNFFRNLLVAAGAGADFFRISLTGRRNRLILGYGMAQGGDGNFLPCSAPKIHAKPAWTMQLPAENRHLTRSGASGFFFPCGRFGVFLGNRSVMILGVSLRVRSPKPVIGIAAPESISIGQTRQRNEHEYHQCNKRNQFLFHFVFLLFQSISSSYIQAQVLSGKQQGNAVSPVRRKVSRLGSDQCN